MKLSLSLFLILLLVTSPAFSGQAQVVNVKATNIQGGYRFDVTIKHADTGWDHYADGWEVLSPSGDVLGERELLHPHVNEQPFTRSISKVKVPAGTKTVLIRAHDSVHGYNKNTFEVKLH